MIHCMEQFPTLIFRGWYPGGVGIGLAMLLSLLTGAAGAAGGFDQVFELQGITFHVICPNQGSINQLEIIPAGLEVDNTVGQESIDRQTQS